MLELYIDLGVASELDLVILDPEWSRSGQTGAPGAPDLYPSRKEVKGGRTKTCKCGC